MYLLALTEMCQRFAFWGIGNLLVLYLVQAHSLSDSHADQIFGIFTGAAFILPLLGGYIADRLGYRLPVIWGCISTAIGCFLIATGVLPLVYLALVFTAIGGAIFTPSVYAILGRVYHNKHALRDGGFSIYYAAVNIGVFAAMILLGAMGQNKHWNLAFLLAGCVQILGLAPFRSIMRKVDLDNSAKKERSQKSIQFPAKLHKHEKNRIFVILTLAFFSIFFWFAYNQGGSSMNLVALRFVDRQIGNFEIPPSWFLSMESLYLILLAYPLAMGYSYLVSKKKDPTPPMKCALSLFAMGLCFLIMTFATRKIPQGALTGLVGPSYLVVAYGVMALGEMLICPIGLSLITHLSPHRYTAFLVGVWYVCIGVAFYLGGTFASFMNEFKLSEFFNVFVVIAFLSAIVLLLLVKKLEKMRHANTL